MLSESRYSTSEKPDLAIASPFCSPVSSTTLSLIVDAHNLVLPLPTVRRVSLRRAAHSELDLADHLDIAPQRARQAAEFLLEGPNLDG